MDTQFTCVAWRADAGRLRRSVARSVSRRVRVLPGRPMPAHEATQMAFVCVAGSFSPTGRGALQDVTSHPLV
ncbi:MAG: hypothetical protein ACUVS4_01750 [Chloroflexaceae bacterium]